VEGLKKRGRTFDARLPRQTGDPFWGSVSVSTVEVTKMAISTR